jgi:hypothetical protein
MNIGRFLKGCNISTCMCGVATPLEKLESHGKSGKNKGTWKVMENQKLVMEFF